MCIGILITTIIADVVNQFSHHFNLRITLRQPWNESLSDRHSDMYKKLDYKIIAIVCIKYYKIDDYL